MKITHDRGCRILRGTSRHIALTTLITILYCIGSTSLALAIPSAGVYDWDPGGPLIGSFESDGTTLTSFSWVPDGYPSITWDIDSLIFYDVSYPFDLFVVTYEPGIFFSAEKFLLIQWSTPELNGPAILVRLDTSDSTVYVDDVSFSLQPGAIPAVPEPGTILLLSTGLLGLAGYRWAQRRRERTQLG